MTRLTAARAAPLDGRRPPWMIAPAGAATRVMAREEREQMGATAYGGETLSLSRSSAAALREPLERAPSLVLTDPSGARFVRLPSGGALRVGRSAPSEVVVPSPYLSREHASFALEGGHVRVVDIGSKNGVLVRGAAVREALLSAGDEVMLGPVRVSVLWLDADERSQTLRGHDWLASLLEAEVTRARFFGRALSLLHVRGEGVPAGALGAFVRTLVRPVDRVALYGHEGVDVLLPEARAEDALFTASSIAAARREGLGALSVGVSTFPDQASSEELLEAAREASRRATPKQRVVRASSAQAGGAAPAELVATSASMRALLEKVGRVAHTPAPVLLVGETGSGKEVVARLVHERSPRATKPFVAVNCGALPEHLVESTLFGHERGAFTGAVAQAAGVFEAADGGTVFLDELGELPLSAQAALLRVLETKRVTRVGSTRELAAEFRVVAATHRDLEEMVREGRFREDLYYRLSTFTFVVPPLRARPDDLEPLVELFLRRAREQVGARATGLSPHALAVLRAYAFPGNVRELRNAVDYAAITCDGEVVEAHDLPDRVARAVAAPLARAAVTEASDDLARTDERGADARFEESQEGSYSERLADAERAILLGALRQVGGRLPAAAERLSMPLRTLKYRLKHVGLRREDYG